MKRLILILLLFTIGSSSLSQKSIELIANESHPVGQIKEYTYISYKYSKGKKPQFEGKFIFKFSRNQQLINELWFFNPDSANCSINYDYNGESMKPDTATYFDLDSDFQNFIVYSYDSLGQRIKEIQYSLNWNILHKKIYYYNDRWNQINEYYYYTLIDTNLYHHTLYRFDENDNFTSKERLDSTGIMYASERYQYDESGRLRQTVYSVSKRGLMKVQKKIHFEYEFDEHGNWIKRTAFEGNRIEYVTERTISYWD